MGMAVKCPHCGTDNADWLSRCVACGKSLGDTVQTRQCVSCGRAIAFDVNVCPYCGHDYRVQHVPPLAREEISTGMRILLYIVSFLIPIAGFIIGIVFWTRPDPESKHVGKICVALGAVSILLTVGLSALLYVMVIGFGNHHPVNTPAVTYQDFSVEGGRRVTILAISTIGVSWDDVTIQLTDGTSFATWDPYEALLNTGPGAVQNLGTRMCGSMQVQCTVTDIVGNGVVNGADYYVLTATYSTGATYESWLLYLPTAEKMGTGTTWTS